MKKIENGMILRPVRRAHGGAHVVHNKNTADMPAVRIPTPERVTIAMRQHIGAPCVPLVKRGDYVTVGQKIGDSDKYVSSPVHASISGKVVSIDELEFPGGIRTQGVTIESDGEMKLCEDIHPPKINTYEDALKAARESGLVGLGGAGFPTHIKLDIRDKDVDTLIINAAECEPYITVDYRECIDNRQDILRGVHDLREIFGFKRVIIAAEDNKPLAFQSLSDIADTGENVNMMRLKSRYPQGAEKVLIYTVTGRKVPPGRLPADVGCVVMNVTSVGLFSRYLHTGKPLVSRSLTVDGDAITHPQNVRVPIGTRIRDVIDFCGGYQSAPYKLLMGGPMMGSALYTDDLPIIKNNNAILAFAHDPSKIKKTRACIRCGRCVQACPMNLMPTKIENLTRTGDASSLQACGADICMECGSCAYACPSGRPLVQYMRLAKNIIREAGVRNE